MLKATLMICIGASLTACSSHLQTMGTSISLTESISENKAISSFILPYKDSMESAMNQIIATTSSSLDIGRPSSLLGNWTSDALLVNQTRNVKLSEPVFCLLNTGGIRSSIGAGNVTLGDIFRIMPFDNRVVWVKLPVSSLTKIEYYLNQSGGEPISNAQVIQRKLSIQGVNESTSFVWVITTDYLANGGDNMLFFQDATERFDKTTLLRDVFIEEARFQQHLIISNEKRIQ